METSLKSIEDRVGKGEIAGYHFFFLFPVPRVLQKAPSAGSLTLSQMTNFRPFQIERACR